MVLKYDSIIKRYQESNKYLLKKKKIRRKFIDYKKIAVVQKFIKNTWNN